MASKSKTITTVAAGALALAAGLIVDFEGKENSAYLDPPGVVSICYGHTGKDVHLGQIATDKECFAYLEKDMASANAVIDKYVKVPLSVERRAAILDFIYNLGEGNFKRSTLLKKLNSGDIAGACKELTRWTRSGGQELPGLVRRRQAEKELCLK